MNETNNQLEETGSGTGKFDIYIYRRLAKKLRLSCSRSRAPFSGTDGERCRAILTADLFDRWWEVGSAIQRTISLSPLVQIRGARESEERKFEKREGGKKERSIHPSIRPSIEGKEQKEEEKEKREEKGRRCARVALIRPSASLSPSSCTVPVEYRLSVVRLGVLRSSKYLGIFEEARVPKKTVYFVGKEGSFPGEAEQAETGAVFY